jgi:hypothetical protein
MSNQRISKYTVPPGQRSVFMQGNGEGCFWFAWTIGVILTVAFWAAVIFVAVHFIQKWW